MFINKSKRFGKQLNIDIICNKKEHSRIEARKTIQFMIAFCVILALSSCDKVEQMLASAEGQLFFTKRDEAKINPSYDYEATYVNYEEFFLKDGEEQVSTGRYSDITPDEKINWKTDIDIKFCEDTPVVTEMFKKITVNGQKVTMPCKFKDLGEEYAVFDKIDFTRIDKKMFPFTIRDEESGKSIYSKEFLTARDGRLMDIQLVDILQKNNEYMAGIHVNIEKNNITAFDNGYDILPQLDIRIDGIGIGSTLNEVYEKFGAPIRIDTLSYLQYEYHNSETNEIYTIYFKASDKVYNSRTGQYEPVRNNLVTDVYISM